MSHLDEGQRLLRCCPNSPQTASNDSWSDTHEPARQPLQGLKLAERSALEEAQKRGRLKCSKCGGSRMFFCYTCCALVGVSQDEVPTVQLPLKIDIIKHPNETDGKSTAIHAKILAPDDVTIYTYPCIPEYERDKVVLVFPGPGSVTMGDMLQRLPSCSDGGSADSHDRTPSPKRPRLEQTPGATHTAQDEGSGAGCGTEDHDSGESSLQRVVFIDSTWNQTNKIITDERLQSLLQVELKTRKTCFWRHQKGKPNTYLATIEAIYYFLKDYHEQCLARHYSGEYDNLLFFYSYLHSLITKAKTSAGKL